VFEFQLFFLHVLYDKWISLHMWVGFGWKSFGKLARSPWLWALYFQNICSPLIFTLGLIAARMKSSWLPTMTGILVVVN